MNAGDHRRLVEREVLHRLRKVQLRGRLDAIDAVSPVHLVGVHREDLFLRVALLDLKGEEHLLDLAFRRELVRQKQLSGELLGDRAGPAAAPASRGPPHGRNEEATNVDPAVVEERTVLGRDERVAQHGRNVGVGDDHAPFGGELADDGAVASDDAGDRSRRVLVERRDLREVTRKREEYAAGRARHRGEEEERRDAEVPGEAPGQSVHGLTVYGNRLACQRLFRLRA